MRAMLAEAGLSPEPDGDGFRCTLVAGERRATLRARSTSNWIVLQTVALAPAPAAARRAAVHRALLASNRTLAFARFAIDDAGAVELRAELPTANLQPAEVRAVVDSLKDGLARLDALLGST